MVNNHLLQAQASLFPSVDAALFEAAKNSQSNNEQTILLEGMTQLRREEQTIIDAFTAEAGLRFERFFGLAAAAPTVAQDKPILREELSLIALEELEDDLAISILSTRRESEAHEQLWALNQRFAVLRSCAPGEERGIPFSPVALAKAFQFALRDSDIEDVIKTRLYQHFDSEVLAKNDELLQAVNAMLAAAGLLPNLRSGGVDALIRSRKVSAADDNSKSDPTTPEGEAVTDAVADSVLASSNDEAPGGPDAASHAQQSSAETTAPEPSAGVKTEAPESSREDWSCEQKQEQQALESISQWQQQRVESGAIATTQAGIALGELFDADAVPAEQLGSEDYREVLGDIQRLHKEYLRADEPEIRDVAQQQEAIVGALQRFSHGKERRRVSTTHAQTIDLVGIIFSELLNNALLVDRVKALLSHLHTPYLKIALTDGQFLVSARHPARLLLNDLAEAASRWITAERDTFKVYEKLSQLVHRLIDEYDNDLSLIEALREDFANYCERLERRVQLAEKRNAQMQDGVDRLQAARDHSQKIVQRRVEARHLPAEAAELIVGSWTEFLAFVFLRFGLGSQYWGRAVVMLNRAVVRVHAALLHGDSQALAGDSAISKLDAQLQAEILEFGYAQQDAEAMLALLQTASQLQPEPVWFKTQKGRGRGHEVAQEAAVVDESLQEDISLDFEHHELDDTLDAEERAIGEKLKHVQSGQWFEWLALNGSLERKLKLAWSNPATGRYMFVDQAGAKTETLDLNELTRLVHRGRVRTANLDQKSFLERLFDGFIASLRQNV
jgi:hypothetical protein